MKFIFLGEEGMNAWTVEAPDKHNAISKAVENGYSDDMSAFYYGLEDGQISVYEIEKEI